MYDPLSGGGQKYESDEPAHATHAFPHPFSHSTLFWGFLLLGSGLHPVASPQHTGCGGGSEGANGSRTHCGAVGIVMLHRHDWLNSGVGALQCSVQFLSVGYGVTSGGGQKYESAKFVHATHVFPHPFSHSTLSWGVLSVGSGLHPLASPQHVGCGSAGEGVGIKSDRVHWGNNGLVRSHAHSWLNTGVGSLQCSVQLVFVVYGLASGGGQKYERDGRPHA